MCDLVYVLCAPADPDDRVAFDRELELPGWTEATRRLGDAIEAM